MSEFDLFSDLVSDARLNDEFLKYDVLLKYSKALSEIISILSDVNRSTLKLDDNVCFNVSDKLNDTLRELLVLKRVVDLKLLFVGEHIQSTVKSEVK